MKAGSRRAVCAEGGKKASLDVTVVVAPEKEAGKSQLLMGWIFPGDRFCSWGKCLTFLGWRAGLVSGRVQFTCPLFHRSFLGDHEPIVHSQPNLYHKVIVRVKWRMI